MAAEQVAREHRYIYNEPVDYMTFMTGDIIMDMADIFINHGDNIEVQMEVFLNETFQSFEVYDENDYINIFYALLENFDSLYEFKFRFCIIPL